MRTLRRVERGTRPLLLELRRTFRDRARLAFRFAAEFLDVRRASSNAEPERAPSGAGRRFDLLERASRRVDRRLLSSVGDDLRDARSRLRVPFRSFFYVFRSLRRRTLARFGNAAVSFPRRNVAARSGRVALVRLPFYAVDALAGKRDAELPAPKRRSFFPLATPFRARRRRLLDFSDRSAFFGRAERRTPSRRRGSQLDFPRTPFRRDKSAFRGVRYDASRPEKALFLTAARPLNRFSDNALNYRPRNDEQMR